MNFEKIKIGDSATTTKQITDAMVRLYADISGDNNPIHLDDEFAEKTIFGKRIVQGLFVSSLISGVIANQLPGNGSIYLNQNLNFKAPVFIDDHITVQVEVTDLRIDKRIVYLKTICTNDNGTVVIEGTAIVKKP